MSKGSWRRPARNLKQADENWEKVFGEKRENPDVDPETNRVRYKQDPETGKMIPDYMWAQYDMLPPEKPRGPMIIRDTHYEYVSEASGKVISGKRQQRYDLESTGCRMYEGRASEERAAKSFREQEDKKLDRFLDKELEKTLSDIRYQRVKPIERSKNGDAKITWEW